VGYQSIYNAKRLRKDIMQMRCHICRPNFAKKMERNLHETTSWYKTYGKRLFSEDLEVQDVALVEGEWLVFKLILALIMISIGFELP
jgi:hypothetical protein